MLKDLKIHHIGYLVKDIHKACRQFKELGYEYVIGEEFTYDETRGVNILFLEKDGIKIELVCPNDNNSVVAKLRKNGGIHRIIFVMRLII